MCVNIVFYSLIIKMVDLYLELMGEVSFTVVRYGKCRASRLEASCMLSTKGASVLFQRVLKSIFGRSNT